MIEQRGTDEAGHAMMWELLQAHRELRLLLKQQTLNAAPADQSLSAAARRLLADAVLALLRYKTQVAEVRQ